jgi:Zn-dependent protease
LLAVLFGIILRFGILSSLPDGFTFIAATIVIVNLVLATFNLLPIPPLDGSKIIFSVFPRSLYGLRRFFEQYGMFILIFFIVFVWQYLLPVVSAEFHLITGMLIM